MATTNKTLNTRIQLKYDLYANWTSANPVLLKGEIAVVEIPAASNAVTNEPALLFKVGDGSKSFNSLGWASATAADVHAWAKEANLTITKDGTGNVVASIVWDASANGGKGGIKYTTASVATSEGLAALQATVDTINKDYLKAADKAELITAIEAAEKAGTDAAAAVDAKLTDEVARAKAAEAQALTDAKAYTDEKDTAMDIRVDALETKFGEGEGSVADQIADAVKVETDARIAAVAEVQAEVDALEETHATDKSALEEAIAAEVTRAKGAEQTLTDNLAAEVTRAQNAEKVNADAIAVEKGRLDTFLSAADVSDKAIDTLKEIQDYITSDGAAAAEMTSKIEANAAAITAEVTRATSVEEGLNTRLTAVEAYDHEADVKAAKDYADSLAKNYDAVGSAKAVDDKLTAEVSRATAAEAQALADAKAYADGLAGNYDASGSAASALTEAKSYADQAETDAISAAAADAASKYVPLVDGKSLVLDTEITKLATVEANAEKNIIEGIKVNGVMLVPDADRIVDISHNVDDLEQDADTYVVFNCGSATTVI